MKPQTEGLTMNQLAERNAEYVTTIAELEARCAALAAENAALKQSELDFDEMAKSDYGPYWVSELTKTPATDAFLAEVRAQGRNEGINFAASRLAAAFNHGFVDKPMAEVGDVVRMILDAKGDLANSPTPPDDGLSGEYAEKALEDWSAQLRQEAK